MRKIVNRIYFDLSIPRNKEELQVPARFLYVRNCPGDLYVMFENKEDETLNLKDVKFIDLAGISRIYITNPAGSGTAELLFTSLLKIEFV